MPLRVEKLEFVKNVHTHLQRFHHNWEKNKEQLGNVFQCLIDRFSYKKEDRYDRAELLGKFSMKWNKKQLDDAFNSLKHMLNRDDYYFYTEALGAITVKMSGKQFDRAFNYLISELDCERRNIYIDKYAYLLDEIAQKLDKKQMNI
ncbi:hypothetical protein RFI_40240, partial [Reticulomyxa filosa]